MYYYSFRDDACMTRQLLYKAIMNVHSVYVLRCCSSSLLCRNSLGLASNKLNKTAASLKVGNIHVHTDTLKDNHTDCMLISENNESMSSRGRMLLCLFCGKKIKCIVTKICPLSLIVIMSCLYNCSGEY